MDDTVAVPRELMTRVAAKLSGRHNLFSHDYDSHARGCADCKLLTDVTRAIAAAPQAPEPGECEDCKWNPGLCDTHNAPEAGELPEPAAWAVREGIGESLWCFCKTREEAESLVGYKDSVEGLYTADQMRAYAQAAVNAALARRPVVDALPAELLAVLHEMDARREYAPRSLLWDWLTRIKRAAPGVRK